MERFKIIIITAFSFLLLNTAALGQISIGGTTPVTETFDSMGTTSNLPANWRMSAAGITANWTTASNVTTVTQVANSGTPTAGGRYNWGTTAGTDRAIGFMTSGGYDSPNTILAFYRNTSGSVINDLTINFDFERYRINTSAASVTFFTSTDGTTWTARTAGDIAAGVFATGSSSYTFGSPQTVSRSVVLSGVNIANNGNFYVRWVVNTTGANSQGLGLDNVSATAALAPVAPNLSINDVSLNEGNSGTTSFTFTVSLTGPAPGGGVTFDIATADGTALQPGDYAQKSLTSQTIPAGSTTYSFTVLVNGDTALEPNETFFVNITNVTGATVTDGQGQGTIVNDDSDTTSPLISYTPLAAKETASTSTLVVTVTDNVAVQSVSINYTIGSGTLQTVACTLASGSDYNCIIDETGGAGQSISYYVNATDTSNNTSRNPSVANNGYAIGTSSIQGGTYDTLNVLSGSLNGNVLVNTNFSYSGIITSSGGTLELGCNATLDAGNPNKFINAAITKNFCSASQTFTYPLGNMPVLNNLGVVTGYYTPLTVNVTSVVNPSSLTVSVTDSTMSGADPLNSISRYWTLTENGSITADLTFQYNAGDVTGNESGFKVLRNENGTTTSFADSVVDTNNHIATVTGISDFSLWSVGNLAPLAADASISGYVRDSNGNGISKVLVKVSGGDLNEPILVMTNPFGYFSFEVSAGQTYLVTVNSKSYIFSNPSQIISVNDNVDDLNFIADER